VPQRQCRSCSQWYSVDEYEHLIKRIAIRKIYNICSKLSFRIMACANSPVTITSLVVGIPAGVASVFNIHYAIR
jgi:hypothetical protein